MLTPPTRRLVGPLLAVALLLGTGAGLAGPAHASPQAGAPSPSSTPAGVPSASPTPVSTPASTPTGTASPAGHAPASSAPASSQPARGTAPEGKLQPRALPSVVPTVAPAGAAATGAFADAFGLSVNAVALAGNVPANVGPVSRTTREFPPSAANGTAQVANTGQVPAGGALVNNVDAITALSSASPAGGVAAVETTGVGLLNQAAVPLVTADVVQAQSNTACTGTPNADGTQILGLKIAGMAINGPFPPNTVITIPPVGAPPLPVLAIVIVNEQHPTSEGRGLVVNGLHVIGSTAGASLLQGDVIVSHAVSSAVCPNLAGGGSTGGSSPITFTKNANPTTVAAGGTTTYTATVANRGATTPCLVNSFTDHLPIGFTVVSTSGSFGMALPTSTARMDGGVDAVFNELGKGLSIAPGQTLTQQIVVRVGADVQPGTFFNNLDVLCGNLGEFASGPLAPVTVVAQPAGSASSAAAAPAVASGRLATTGLATALPVAALGLVLAGAGMAAGLVRRRRGRLVG